MARISTYSQDTSISVDDLLIGTDAEDSNITKNYKIGDVKDFIAGTQLVTAKVTVTSAQLLSLNGGGTIELIEAAGANKIIVPISFSAFIDFNTAAYVSSPDANIKLRSGTTATFGDIAKTTIETSSDRYFTINPAGQQVGVNENINFTADSSFDLTTGDSPMVVNIAYRIVDFS